jgi:acyl-CoA synthetase (NDP forming)
MASRAFSNLFNKPTLINKFSNINRVNNKLNVPSVSNALLNQSVRYLNLHEYQSKALMAKHGIRVQRGEVASSPEEALSVAKKLASTGAKDLVIKAQIHAGGRGN